MSAHAAATQRRRQRAAGRTLFVFFAAGFTGSGPPGGLDLAATACESTVYPAPAFEAAFAAGFGAARRRAGPQDPSNACAPHGQATGRRRRTLGAPGLGAKVLIVVIVVVIAAVIWTDTHLA